MRYFVCCFPNWILRITYQDAMNMFYLKLFIFISLLPFAFPNYAMQKDSTHIKELTMQSGISTLHSIDYLYTYKIFTGTGLHMQLGFTFGKEKSSHRIYSGYACVTRYPDNLIIPEEFNLFNNRYRQLKSVVIDLNYSYIRKMNSRFASVYITGNVFASTNKSKGSELEWLYCGVGPGCIVSKKLNKNIFSMELSYPLVSFTLRNSYYTLGTQTYNQDGNEFYVKELMQIKFFTESLMIYGTIGYKFLFTEKFKFIANYHFRYVRIKYPRLLEGIMVNYAIGCSYTF